MSAATELPDLPGLVPAAAVLERALEGLYPDALLTVSEWADAHRVLTRRTANPGPWRTDKTPYLREIMDALSDHVREVHTVAFMAGAQIGKTSAAENLIGYTIHHAPGSLLFVEPTVELAKRISKQRVAPMIADCPELSRLVRPARMRDSGNTVLEKEFDGGAVVFTGANSAVGLRQMAVRKLVLDEVDGYPADVDGEGDPIDLAERRTSTYGNKRKVFIASTPTTRGASAIEAIMLRTDWRVYEVPCPKCGDFAAITWKRIEWDHTGEGADKVHHPETVRLVCEKCGARIRENQKTAMLAGGRWTATREGEKGFRGYHLSSLYSPVGWYSWEKAVRDFLAAKRKGSEALQTWTNTVLGETWQEEGEKLSADVLFARREPYGCIVPAGALVLTAGVDVQANRIEVEVVGWGYGEESWAVDYHVIDGSHEDPETWNELSAVLGGSYTWADTKDVRLPITCAAVDANYATQAVYAYVREAPANVYAVRGSAGEGRPIAAHLSRKTSGATKAKVMLFTVGVDLAKDILYRRLRKPEAGPGCCHFPSDRPGFGYTYFEQLTAETKRVHYVRGFPHYRWEKTRLRNEALDCRVYAMAALYIANPVLDAFAAALHGARDAERDKAPAAAPAVRQRRNWVTDW